jgi:hypothetical protein
MEYPKICSMHSDLEAMVEADVRVWCAENNLSFNSPFAAYRAYWKAQLEEFYDDIKHAWKQ